MGRAFERLEGVWSFAFLLRTLLLLFLIGLTDIFLSRNQNVSNHLRQSICSQCSHSTVHMQHYSKPASFQETQSSREVNIYLHSLTLLSVCLIFLSDFPLLFHYLPQQSAPQLCFKTSSTKRHDFLGGFILHGPDDAICILLHLWRLWRCVCTSCLMVQWSLLCIIHKSSWNTHKGHLCLFCPSHLSCSNSLPTPPLHSFVIAVKTIIIFSTSRTSSASLGEAPSCLTLPYPNCLSSQLLLNSTDQCHLGTTNDSS